jgi:hypothetical protein
MPKRVYRFAHPRKRRPQRGGLLVVFAHGGKATIQELVRRGLPAVLGALLLIMAYELRD